MEQYNLDEAVRAGSIRLHQADELRRFDEKQRQSIALSAQLPRPQLNAVVPRPVY